MLVVYAISAVILVGLRKLPAKALIAIGAVAFLLSVPNILLMQHIVDTTDVLLIGILGPGERARGADAVAHVDGRARRRPNTRRRSATPWRS